MTSSVYFILYESDPAFIKIGFSDTPQKRMEALSVWCPIPMRLLATLSGWRTLEAELHARFEHLRHRGEWFRAEPELLDFVERVKSGDVVSASMVGQLCT